MSTDSRGDYSHPPGSDPLAHLYAEWRSLTEAEGRAIEIAAWDHLLSLQQAKAQPGLDRSDRFAQALGDFCAGKAAIVSKLDCLALVGRQLGQRIAHGIALEALVKFIFRAA